MTYATKTLMKFFIYIYLQMCGKYPRGKSSSCTCSVKKFAFQYIKNDQIKLYNIGKIGADTGNV